MAEGSTKTEYKVQLVSTEAVPQPDNLIAGTDHKAAMIKLAAEGEYQRGTLLMAGTDGYVAAASPGYASAVCCILCDDVTVPSDSYIETPAYFEGTFNAGAVTLWDGADTDTVAPVLRQKGLWLV